MMNLVKWELVKVFKQKSLYIIGIVLFGWFAMIGVNGVNIDITKDVYRQWQGPITAEKIEKAEKLNQELTEYLANEPAPNASKSAESALTENIALSQTIKNSIKERERELDQEIKKAENNGDTALANKLELQKNMFNKISLDKISYYGAPREAVDFVNVFGLILTGVFLLIGLSGIYSNEHSSGVENYILSAKNGRSKTMRAKMMAAFIFTTVVVFVWEAFNLTMRTAVYGTEGWDMPIQYSYKYFASPYNLTFMEYHLMQVSIHWLAALAFAGVIVVVSTMSRSTMISFFMSGVLFGIPILAQSIMDIESIWLNKALTFTLTNIMKVEDMYMNFISVNIFGNPVLAPFVGVTVAIAIIVFSVVLGRYLIGKKQIA